MVCSFVPMSGAGISICEPMKEMILLGGTAGDTFEFRLGKPGGIAGDSALGPAVREAREAQE